MSEEGLRKTGRTTRIIDQLIQDLFIKGEVIVTDHDNEFGNCNYNLHIIRMRLDTEHRKVKYLINDLTIKLIKDEQ